MHVKYSWEIINHQSSVKENYSSRKNKQANLSIPFCNMSSGGRGSKLPLYGSRPSRTLSMTQSILLSSCYDNFTIRTQRQWGDQTTPPRARVLLLECRNYTGNTIICLHLYSSDLGEIQHIIWSPPNSRQRTPLPTTALCSQNILTVEQRKENGT